MNKAAFLSLLTMSLALGAVTQPQQTALDAWADKFLPVVLEKARGLIRGGFGYAEIGSLAETSVRAAQDLKGIFAGLERAQIAQAVLVVAAREVLPSVAERWVLPLLQGEAVRALIEAAFQRVFGQSSPPGVSNPVTYTSAPLADGSPTTDADFGPSMATNPPGER
ncbi:hypothetical protein DAETH_29100 [Deinococcus aetherius]|uniref:Uncharacterized protein n=1 Tax=Deinococcus aetherius TaxID=200252 RepID=A0ABN6RMG5_9DEIO|nr:hypothetical protein [Deinococcus aetherius]BDP42941.1 hypothetical protein DAETH_29100 [Deinococcus aetherius]